MKNSSFLFIVTIVTIIVALFYKSETIRIQGSIFTASYFLCRAIESIKR